MLIEIYILLTIFAVFFMALSFFSNKSQCILCGLISFLFFSANALSSFNVEKSYCDTNSTLGWSCHEESYAYKPLGYLHGGLAVFMLSFTIIIALWVSGEEMQQALR